jgi:hypothetical protein
MGRYEELYAKFAEMNGGITGMGALDSYGKEALDSFRTGTDSPFTEAVQQKFQHAKHVLLSKQKDYGPKNISQAPGGPLNGLRVRMHDKLARINHLIESGATPEHESLQDSFLDMANYAIIAMMVLDGEWPDE